MPVLEVFFDYACPFCLRAHRYLEELAGRYPGVEIAWRPCEAHPRPDPYGPHSDLCIRGMFYAQEQGVDLWEYHAMMYRVALTDRVDIEDPDVLAGVVQPLLDPEDFREMLRGQQYLEQQREANPYAFGQNGVWAVPSYRMEGRKLDSVENVGVSREQLEAFIRRV